MDHPKFNKKFLWLVCLKCFLLQVYAYFSEFLGACQRDKVEWLLEGEG